MNREILRKYNYQKDKIEKLIKSYRAGEFNEEDNVIDDQLGYPSSDDFKTLPPRDSKEYKKLDRLGKEAIENGQLGVVVLNGGMATRFGGVVKGVVEVFDGKSFLELKIKDSLRVSDKIDFYIMNSFSTHEKTRKHFEDKNYFGVPDKIHFFNQFIAPRLKEDGSYFEGPEEMDSFYGPGHGDFPYCIKKSGRLDEFIDGGGKYLFYSNVDNLGARVEPALLGKHINSGKELTAEVAKKDPGDEGGAPAVLNGKLQIIEGFRFPEDFDQDRIPVFNCNTYWLNAQSLKKEFDLPWYIVHKQVEGETVIQFEHLAGDLTGFLDTSFVKIDRSSRFYPVKRPQDLDEYRESLKKLLGYK
ncbi:MAG: UTP--glucose-1-phosphate uridylyltransferase [Elusimicrobiota bacterium]